MAGSEALPALAPVAGVRLGAVEAGIRKPGRLDLALFQFAPGTVSAGVFTRNRFRAAPVRIAESHLGQTSAARYWLVNTGNANAGTGAAGERAALACCAAVAEAAGCERVQVLPFSTGVIGEPLPEAPILSAVPGLLQSLSEDGWARAARAILTTDTRPKGASRQLELDGRPVTLTGIAKGAGMIRPDMATMLAFVATDAPLEPGLARRLLREAVAVSFNRITVDGDTSTNDACLLAATGQAGGEPLADPGSAAARAFGEALTDLCTELAQAIVGDGEGATRFVSVEVAGAASVAEAERVAFTVAESPLVKTALFAGDPNWGRILAAVGRAGVDDLDVAGVTIHLGPQCIAAGGERSADYSEADAARYMAGREIEIRVGLGRGDDTATVWTCDLSYDYVKINAEYRT